MQEPDGILKEPTVADVIELLKRMPPESPFRMEDADTGWTISTIRWRLGGDLVFWFWGEYSEMPEMRRE